MMEEINLENLEEHFYQEGYAGGAAHGELHGLFEGRAIGREKGWELWEEVGYYEGVARMWKAILLAKGSQTTRAFSTVEQLLALVDSFPTSNDSTQSPSDDPSHVDPSSVDIPALLTSIRSKYRTFLGKTHRTAARKYQKTDIGLDYWSLLPHMEVHVYTRGEMWLVCQVKEVLIGILARLAAVDATIPQPILLPALFSVFLVLIGGVLSGLSVGLMGLDMINLRVLTMSSTSQATRADAKKVLTLLEKGRHWVLVCLLLTNVVVNEALPIFLDNLLGSGLEAIITSTTLIVIFGEIIPQAVCARWGMKIGAMCASSVLTLMYLEAPVAYPCALLLDKLIGVDHGKLYSRHELAVFVGLHADHSGTEEGLEKAEAAFVSGALSTVMTPVTEVFTLSESDRLDHHKITQRSTRYKRSVKAI
ncbi:hypothetical protein MNV49_002694 [Pseudohyphozyma bogoriensis]|nr:hypothetical protein MNV49_002694 [Pseudohyphozyma bogoriensis]